MKTSEELFKAWSHFLYKEKKLLTEDDLNNLQNIDFCRNHKFLGRYGIPVILLRNKVENDHKYDGRLYKRFFLFDKYSISNDWYHSETETNRRDFFRWFINLCKQRRVYDKVPQIMIEEAEMSDKNIANDLFDNKIAKSKENTRAMSYCQNILFGAPGTGKSFKIDDPVNGYGLKAVDKYHKFRTTFHPDYDYAQFVGAYKPLKTHDSSILNKNELIERLKEMKDTDRYPVHKFSALYSDSLLKLSNVEQAEIIKESGTPESMSVELKKGIAVGEFLKSKSGSSSITYSFVPQVFAKAYVAAWKLYFSAGNASTSENQIYLVIEEINRGNCAQIFGDIFQLLDRDSEGFSQYSIDADCDFAEWLETDEDGLKSVWDKYKEVVGEGKLMLPPNLNILATMNTSDQSLFPMDSAFKRRFDWEYVPINYSHEKANFDVAGDGVKFKWLAFLKKVNADIYKATESEDKQMGEFFIKPKNGSNEIGLPEFRSKVLFYLWDSVYKDDPSFKNIFHFNYPEKDGSVVTFQRLFADDFAEILKQMLKNLDEAYKDGEFKDLKILNG